MVEDKKDNKDNYLDYVPVRIIEHERDENQRVVLLRPRFMKGLLGKFIQPHVKTKHYRVRLDEFGSKTWEAIDGKRTVGQIADLLYAQFGDSIEPRFERLAKFIQSLQQGSMIDMQDDTTETGSEAK